jgi:ribonuclease R
VLQHLEKHLGDEFDGVVTGVANVGVFVQLPQFLIDGLVRFADLPDDWWELDQKAGMLVGQRSGRRIQIGDRMRVAVAAIDIASRELNLALVKWTPRASSAASPTAQKDKAKKHKAKRPPGRRGRRRAR